MENKQIIEKRLHWHLVSKSVLRIAIGWHFLYEGLVKVINPDWSSADFLNSSVGPFAGVFKSIALHPTMLGMADFLNQWGLVLIGISLMLGLFSRWACLGGMFLLSLYYFANPPFIGLANASITEGSYLIVNKNLIEMLALWVLFHIPGSRDYGLDRFLAKAANTE